MATSRERFNPYDLEHVTDIGKFMKEHEEKLPLERRKTKGKNRLPTKGILAPRKKQSKSSK